MRVELLDMDQGSAGGSTFPIFDHRDKKTTRQGNAGWFTSETVHGSGNASSYLLLRRRISPAAAPMPRMHIVVGSGTTPLTE